MITMFNLMYLKGSLLSAIAITKQANQNLIGQIIAICNHQTGASTSFYTYIDPINMILKVVNRVRNQLNVALLEVRLVHCNATQLCGANRREVARMRKEHTPSDN